MCNNSTLEEHNINKGCLVDYLTINLKLIFSSKENFHAKINKTVYHLLFPVWFIFYETLLCETFLSFRYLVLYTIFYEFNENILI